MDRQIVYAGAIPQDLDVLNTNRDAMTALGMALQAILGTTTIADGLPCTPTTPASMSVNVGAGSIYSLQNVDNSAYGSLAADTADQIVKQGLVFGTSVFNCPAPGTSGFSTAYLIQASYQDSDSGSEVLPYYNSSNPAVPYNGPNNTGVSQATVRKGVCLLQLKAGTPAPTNTQVLPAADVGAIPLYAISVANGQTTITSGAILQLGSFITPKLTGVNSAIQTGAALYAPDLSGAANTITITLNPSVSSLVAGQRINVKIANTNTGATVVNTNGLGNVSVITQEGNPLPPGAIKANGVYGFIYDGTSWQLQAQQGGDQVVGQCVLQYTSATVVTLSPKNGKFVSFPTGTMQSIGGGVSATWNNCSINGTSGQALAASTLYYAYLVAGSTPILDFSTTGYTIDATSGITIKTSDATRVLVGMVETDASGKFVLAIGNISGVIASILVRSWFNDNGVILSNSFTTTRSTSSNAFAEPSTEIRVNVLTWAGEKLIASITGTAANTTSGDGAQTAIGLDSSTAAQMGYSTVTSTSASVNLPAVASTPALSPSEGSHFLTLLGNNNNGVTTGGAANWSSVTTLTVQTRR